LKSGHNTGYSVGDAKALNSGIFMSQQNTAQKKKGQPRAQSSSNGIQSQKQSTRQGNNNIMMHHQTPKTGFETGQNPSLEMTGKAKGKQDKYSILLAKNDGLSKTLRGPLYENASNTNHQRLPGTGTGSRFNQNHLHESKNNYTSPKATNARVQNKMMLFN
jgi:hypothetical protein